MGWRPRSDTPLGFSCDCGAVRGHITAPAVAAGTHVVCHCADCRAAQLHLGQPDPAPDPVDLFQTTPDAVTFEAGADKLAFFRLGPRGMMRAYASCCNAPLFNLPGNPRLPFAGLHVARVDTPERLGPIITRGYLPQRDGGTRHKGAGRMALGLAVRMAASGLSGRWRVNPFVDPETREPVAAPRVLTREERAALYPGPR